MTNRSLLLATLATTVIGLTACGDDDVDNGGSNDGSVPTLPEGRVDAGLDGSTIPSIDSGLVNDAGSQGDAGAPSVTLRFKAKVGNEDMVCGKSYANIGTSKVTITPRDFRLFIQEVRLITSSGVEVPFELDERSPFQSAGVALLDFTDGEGSCSSGSPTSNVTLTGKVPAGDYTGISFINGVSEALNHADPTLAPAPLQAPGASWGWLAGYRFLMAEVLTVSGDDAGAAHGSDAGAGGHGASDAGAGGHGGATPGLGFVHLGSTACEGTPASGISCSKPNRSQVKLTGFNPLTNTVVADLGAVFATADLSTQVQCHGSGPSCAPMFDALGVELATGAALTTQKVYRVE